MLRQFFIIFFVSQTDIVLNHFLPLQPQTQGLLAVILRLALGLGLEGRRPLYLEGRGLRTAWPSHGAHCPYPQIDGKSLSVSGDNGNGRRRKCMCVIKVSDGSSDRHVHS